MDVVDLINKMLDRVAALEDEQASQKLLNSMEQNNWEVSLSMIHELQDRVGALEKE